MHAFQSFVYTEDACTHHFEFMTLSWRHSVLLKQDAVVRTKRKICLLHGDLYLHTLGCRMLHFDMYYVRIFICIYLLYTYIYERTGLAYLQALCLYSGQSNRLRFIELGVGESAVEIVENVCELIYRYTKQIFQSGSFKWRSCKFTIIPSVVWTRLEALGGSRSVFWFGKLLTLGTA